LQSSFILACLGQSGSSRRSIDSRIISTQNPGYMVATIFCPRMKSSLGHPNQRKQILIIVVANQLQITKLYTVFDTMNDEAVAVKSFDQSTAVLNA
jgi:hypothetical protein